MARNLTFKVNSAEYAASPVKIDRKKLYGWTELKALDDEGRECAIVNMDETGTLILPKGGVGMGILAPDGQWAERSSLKAVKSDGSDAEAIPSSFSAPVELKNAVDADTFFDHNIVSVYQLDEAPAELLKAIGKNIFTFTYSFRDSFKGETAFVLAAADTLFMLVGYKTQYEMLSLAQAEAIDETESEDEEESDDLDFSMI